MPPLTPRKGSLNSGLRCLEALRLLSNADSDLSLQEIAAALELHPSTAHRVLATLVSQGFVEQESGRRYRLSLEAFAVGAGFLRQSAIRRAATPALMRLTERAQASSYLAMWHHGKAIIVDTFPVPGMYNFHSEIGSVVPLHASAIGKALLAFREKKDWERSGPLRRFTANSITSQAALSKELERVRRNGYSTDGEEVVPGCRCVAAPVPNGRAEPLAAVSVSGPPSIVSPKRVPELAGLIQETCFQIAAQLGHQPIAYPVAATR
jgi:IclR family acetate operon transcriptional repressor